VDEFKAMSDNERTTLGIVGEYGEDRGEILERIAALEDFMKSAGKFVETGSPMFEILPEDATIVVGGSGKWKSTTYASTCFICKGETLLDRRDDVALANETNIVVLCPVCYFKMEPQKKEPPCQRS
jgi:hypothetical protein